MKRIFSWIITVTAIANLFWICDLFIQSRDALKWPQTTGEVISSSLTINHLPKFMDYNADPLRWYGDDVRYEYTLDDKTYISNRVSIHDSDTRNPRTALKIMNKYRHQHEISVYYNPANPQESVLEPGNIGDIFVPVMVGVLLAFIVFLRLFDQASEFKVRGIDSYLYQGDIYLKQGKLDLAFNEYNKIIESSPYLARGYSSRGSVYLELGQWDQAITDFNQAIAIDPTDAFVYFKRAKAFLGNKQYDKAWDGMQKAMEMGFTVKPEILEEIKKSL